MKNLLFTIFVLVGLASAGNLISSPQFSRLTAHASVAVYPGTVVLGGVTYPIPASAVIPKVNQSLDMNFAKANAWIYVQPGELATLETYCLNHMKNHYGVDFVTDGYKNATTGSWYHADAIMAPISRTAADTPDVAKLMFDSEYNWQSGRWIASEAGFNLEFQTNGVFGGAMAGVNRVKSTLAQCANHYFFDNDADLTKFRNVEVKLAVSYEPTLVTYNGQNLPKMLAQHRVFFEGDEVGKLTEFLVISRNATHFKIDNVVNYLTYKDPSLL